MILLSRGALARASFIAGFTFAIADPAFCDATTDLKGGPADATAAVPATTYQSLFKQQPGTYLRETNRERLPWRKLFYADGRFIPEETLRGEQIATPTPTPTPPAQVPEKSPHATLPPGSDGRGIVRSVNLEQRKVKLKHGPIQKLDMPGMTMIFRVKDPALLKQIKAGEEVGFTIEMEGSTFYITGFQKEGR